MSMNDQFWPNDDRITEKSTLILASVSVGNVAQLAVDLLINTKQLQSISIPFVNRLCYPIVGAHPYSTTNDELAYAVQGLLFSKLSYHYLVYTNDQFRLIVVQLRADILPHKRCEFIDSLFKWICDRKFNQIFLLTSGILSAQIDARINSSNKIIEVRTGVESNFDDCQDVFRGSGFSFELLHLLNKSKINSTTFVGLCHEGASNIQDAHQLLSKLNDRHKMLSNDDSTWIEPISWQFDE